jgi:hypothetical protein
LCPYRQQQAALPVMNSQFSPVTIDGWMGNCNLREAEKWHSCRRTAVGELGSAANHQWCAAAVSDGLPATKSYTLRIRFTSAS